MSKRRRKQEEKRKRRNLIVGLFLAAIMVVGVAGFVAMGPLAGFGGQAIDFYGTQFRLANFNGVTLLVTDINGQEVPFYNDPFMVENLDVDRETKQALRDASSYQITSKQEHLIDFDLDPAIISRVIEDIALFSQRSVNRGYLEGDNQITCDLGSEQSPVLLVPYTLEEANYTTGIHKIEENCFILSGFNFDLLAIRDYIILNNANII